MAVPAELGQPADDRRRHDEADEVPTGGANDPRDTRGALGEDRQSERTHRDVQQERQCPAPEAERRTDRQHAKGLTGERDRLHRDDDLGRQGDHQRTGDDEHDVPQTGGRALSDADRDQEVGERETALGSGASVEPRDGDRQARLR